MYVAGPVLIRRPRRAHCDIWTQKLLRAVSPVTPRIRAMSRAFQALPGVERKIGQTAARRPGVGWAVAVGGAGGWERSVGLAGRSWCVFFPVACREVGVVGWQMVTSIAVMLVLVGGRPVSVWAW